MNDGHTNDGGTNGTAGAGDEIERWAAYMKAHPDEWKREHTAFIDAQFDKSAAFIKRLALEPGGKAKIMAAYGIKNVKGYPTLLC